MSSRSRAKWSSRSASTGTAAVSSATAARLTSSRSASSDHLDRRRARLVGQERHLAEQRPLEQAGQLDRAGRSAGHRLSARDHPHLARGDEVEGRPGLALAEDHVAVARAQQTRHPHRRREQLRRQLGEEGDRQELLRVLDEDREIERAGAGARHQLGQGRRPPPGRAARSARRDRRAPGGPRTWPASARRGRSCAPSPPRSGRSSGPATRAPCSRPAPAAGAPSGRRASPPSGRPRRRPPDRRAEAAGRRSSGGCRRRADWPPASGRTRPAPGQLTGPGEVAGLGLELAKRKRHCADVIRSVKWGQRGAVQRDEQADDPISRLAAVEALGLAEIGRSTLGRPIFGRRFGGRGAPLLVMGGIHGDEPASVDAARSSSAGGCAARCARRGPAAVAGAGCQPRRAGAGAQELRAGRRSEPELPGALVRHRPRARLFPGRGAALRAGDAGDRRARRPGADPGARRRPRAVRLREL